MIGWKCVMILLLSIKLPIDSVRGLTRAGDANPRDTSEQYRLTLVWGTAPTRSEGWQVCTPGITVGLQTRAVSLTPGAQPFGLDECRNYFRHCGYRYS